MKSHFQMFAAYNAWANNKLYNAAARLSPEAYNRNVGAFFGSMNGTLNHILVGDRIWMKRFCGSGDHPNELDAVLETDFDRLRAEREKEDRRIIDWIDSLTDEALQQEFSYRTITNPADMNQILGPAVSHLFNHQTHHRGQAHMILSVLGEDPPPLDLLYFYRSEDGASHAQFVV
ncbi:MAG: DinB family protein [Rhizobiaceae bacterium]